MRHNFVRTIAPKDDRVTRPRAAQLRYGREVYGLISWYIYVDPRGCWGLHRREVKGGDPWVDRIVDVKFAVRVGS
jgi:hypothetical protein